jgi:hypothetical protein
MRRGLLSFTKPPDFLHFIPVASGKIGETQGCGSEMCPCSSVMPEHVACAGSVTCASVGDFRVGSHEYHEYD